VTKRFDEWREIWRNDEGEPDIKFETFAKTDHITARKVHRQLALMAHALFDAHALDEQFGMKPQRWPDRVGLSLFGDELTLIQVGSQRSHSLQTERRRKPYARNPRDISRTM
jgi:hypothetical protein